MLQKYGAFKNKYFLAQQNTGILRMKKGKIIMPFSRAKCVTIHMLQGKNHLAQIVQFFYYSKHGFFFATLAKPDNASFVMVVLLY